MKANIEPDSLGPDLHPQPPQIPLDHNLFVRLNDLFVVHKLNRLDGDFVRVFILLIFFRRCFGCIENHEPHFDTLVEHAGQ